MTVTRASWGVQGLQWKGLGQRQQSWEALQSQSDQEPFESVAASHQLPPPPSTVQLVERPRLSSIRSTLPARGSDAPQSVTEATGERYPLLQRGHEDSASDGIIASAASRGILRHQVGITDGVILGQAPPSAGALSARAVAAAAASVNNEQLPSRRRPFGRASPDSAVAVQAEGDAHSSQPLLDHQGLALHQDGAMQESTALQGGIGTLALAGAGSGILEDGMGHDRLAIRLRPPEDEQAAQSRADAADPCAGTSKQTGNESPILR